MSEWIELCEIREDERTQARQSTCDDAIAEYIEHLDELPPIDLFLLDDGYYMIGDGWHRYRAHQQAGRGKIRANIIGKGAVDAMFYAAAANAKHGLLRSNADKRRAVKICLDALKVKGETWELREISDHCGVSHEFVRQIKAKKPTQSTVDGDGKDAVSTVDTQPLSTVDRESDTPEEDANLPDFLKDEPEEPDNLITLAAPYKSAVKDLNRIKREMKGLAKDEKLGAHLHDKITRITTEIDSIKATIRGMEPVAWCEKCDGKGCSHCASTGFWTRMIVEAKKK